MGVNDTWAAVNLSPSEREQVVAGVEREAYDIPDSWTSELRIRRVDLGGGPGLVAQGSQLLCGATGNCQVFVLRRVGDRWIPLFGDDQAPVGDGFQFGPGATHGLKDLTITTNRSADVVRRVTYQFDGERYRER